MTVLGLGVSYAALTLDIVTLSFVHILGVIPGFTQTSKITTAELAFWVMLIPSAYCSTLPNLPCNMQHLTKTISNQSET